MVPIQKILTVKTDGQNRSLSVQFNQYRLTSRAALSWVCRQIEKLELVRVLLRVYKLFHGTSSQHKFSTNFLPRYAWPYSSAKTVVWIVFTVKQLLLSLINGFLSANLNCFMHTVKPSFTCASFHMNNKKPHMHLFYWFWFWL